MLEYLELVVLLLPYFSYFGYTMLHYTISYSILLVDFVIFL